MIFLYDYTASGGYTPRPPHSFKTLSLETYPAPPHSDHLIYNGFKRCTRYYIECIPIAVFCYVS